MKNKYELKYLQLHEPEDLSSSYYLSVTYLREDDTGIYEIRIPKIYLPVVDDPIIKTPICRGTCFKESPTIDLGFGDLMILEDKNGHLYYEKLIKEKIHDMTLDEIEKKLGFKVRVVSEKEK